MDIPKRITAIIAEHALLDPGDIGPDQPLEALGIDSLGLVESIFAIEEAFDIQVPFNANQPDNAQFDLTSVRSISEAVEQLVQRRGS